MSDEEVKQYIAYIDGHPGDASKGISPKTLFFFNKGQLQDLVLYSKNKYVILKA